jgi:hypothetical protein
MSFVYWITNITPFKTFTKGKLTSKKQYVDKQTIHKLYISNIFLISTGFLLAIIVGPILTMAKYNMHITRLGQGDDIINQSSTRGSEKIKHYLT